MICAVAGAGIMLFGSVRAAERQTPERPVSENMLKGALLYKIGGFVSWPAEAFASPETPVKICLLGPDPFGGALETLVRNQTIDGRTIVVAHVGGLSAHAGCHILYIGDIDEPHFAKTLAALRDAPLLTVTDSRSPLSGGIINFVLRDNKVRFEIDDQAAVRHRIAISSRLRTLALSVNPRS
jgi:hypothetical protein